MARKVYLCTGDELAETGDEGRKRVVGIMASILAARKLAQYDGENESPRRS